MVQMRRLLPLAAAAATLASAQDYQDYQGYGDDGGGSYQDYADGYADPDGLYADYAMRQEEKAAGKAGGPGVGKMLAAAAGGWVVGAKVHSKRASKKLKDKHMKEQKNLYTQYYNDVYKLQESNAELAYVVEQLQATLQQVEQEREMEAIQRDYDEFKQPDVDGDDRISRAEFNMYVNNYLKNYPGLAEKDYPKFEDFDHDGDGYVSFQEYAQQMKLQAQQAEAETRRAQQAGNQQKAQAAQNKAQAIKGLYGDTRKSDGFNDLYEKMRKY
eukprot:CAMPEP_0183291432 /NCGR_PEP_ID=MMETSP0160_2-20130417/865_1 /TAXON_ID=2839 ORGANISM="Odontella Sinensis, Strain Grunow 1884" /NCGR_SAMPLE_ID=MMETSP0160_2 /ASSEMBLY_ACC=CAM_ASM_000250 /LENGTH=270 /DNA_ID=CAMNT_0025452243 /DNA_START=40 /DNA_END=852 /DNA_ORIENTATION=-